MTYKRISITKKGAIQEILFSIFEKYPKLYFFGIKRTWDYGGKEDLLANNLMRLGIDSQITDKYMFISVNSYFTWEQLQDFYLDYSAGPSLVGYSEDYDIKTITDLSWDNVYSPLEKGKPDDLDLTSAKNPEVLAYIFDDQQWIDLFEKQC